MIRDQKPLNEKRLERCLTDGLTPTDWYRSLNERVFFWTSEERMIRLLGARAYREQAHDVPIVDTERLVDQIRDGVELCPINSGATFMIPAARGAQTFLPIAKYPFDDWRKRRGGGKAIVEVTVKRGVPEVESCATSVVRMMGREIVEVIWKRPD